MGGKLRPGVSVEIDGDHARVVVPDNLSSRMLAAKFPDFWVIGSSIAIDLPVIAAAAAATAVDHEVRWRLGA